jgi:large subunit ribosomal protein L4
VRQLALRHALSSRAQDSRLVVVDSIKCDPAKTKTVVAMLKALQIGGARTLLLTDGVDQTLYRCGRNIKNLSVMPVSYLNAADVLRSQTIVLGRKELVGKLEEAVKQ